MMDLLDLAQKDNNTFKLDKEYFCLFTVVDKAFDMVKHIASAKQVTLVQEEVSQGDEELLRGIYGDANRFIQVITNFLSNSLKFSDRNSCIRV